MLQQKITDELGANLPSPVKSNEAGSADSTEPKKLLSLKNVSLISDQKKSQGQGGGKAKKLGDKNLNLTDEEMRLQEEQEEEAMKA